VLTCLYEVLLHAECDEAVSYAQATYVARGLVDRSAEEVDSVRIGPFRSRTFSAYLPFHKDHPPPLLCRSSPEYQRLSAQDLAG
jgi:hypothetical protein